MPLLPFVVECGLVQQHVVVCWAGRFFSRDGLNRGLNSCGGNTFLPVSATLNFDVNFCVCININIPMQNNATLLFLCQFVYSYSVTRLQMMDGEYCF